MFAANIMTSLLCELACERIARVLWWSGYADLRVHEVVFSVLRNQFFCSDGGVGWCLYGGARQMHLGTFFEVQQ